MTREEAAAMLAEKEPDKWAGAYSWHCDGMRDLCDLPKAVFDLVAGHSGGRLCYDDQIEFHFRKDAMTALASALASLVQEPAS